MKQLDRQGCEVSAEGLHRGFIAFKHLKQVQDPHQFKRLQDHLRRTHQLQATAALLGGGESAHQSSDAAGINDWHLGQIQNDIGIAGLQKFVYCNLESIELRTELQTSTKLDDLNIGLLANVDIQERSKTPRNNRKYFD